MNQNYENAIRYSINLINLLIYSVTVISSKFKFITQLNLQLIYYLNENEIHLHGMLIVFNLQFVIISNRQTYEHVKELSEF